MSDPNLISIVVVPTYNEAETIRLLLADILSLRCPSCAASCPPTAGSLSAGHVVSIDVVIVDDYSSDDTGLIADEMAARHPSVHVIHHPEKLGLGTAYAAGCQYALAHSYDQILTVDAHSAHHPSYIPAMIDTTRSEVDLIIASRYVKEGSTHDRILSRRLFSWGANTLARVMLGLRATDCTTGFRCYRREVLESLDLDSMPADDRSFQIQTLYKCQRQGWRVGEMPILLESRRYGQYQVSRQEITRALYTVLRLGKERLRPTRQKQVHPWRKRGMVNGVR